MQQKYKWKQLSMWDVPNPKYYIKTKKVETGLSSAICTFMLVCETEPNKDGYIRSTPVLKSDVTKTILSLASEIG